MEKEMEGMGVTIDDKEQVICLAIVDYLNTTLSCFLSLLFSKQ